MASKKQLDRVRQQIHEARVEQEFAGKHGYDAAYQRRGKQIEQLETRLSKLKGLN